MHEVALGYITVHSWVTSSVAEPEPVRRTGSGSTIDEKLNFKNVPKNSLKTLPVSTGTVGKV